MEDERTKLTPTHKHKWVYVRTDENWFDGDEEDIYRCECGEVETRYIGR